MYSILTYAHIADAEATAKANLAHEREAVATIIESNPGHLIYERLSKAVNSLAEAEGRYVALAHAQRAYKGGGDPFLAVVMLTENGPGDTWSGRDNDTRRAYFDGVLDVLRDVRTAGKGV